MKIGDQLESLGISLLYKPLSRNIRGNSFCKDGVWQIIVNSSDIVERKNFTIAHEFFEIYLDNDKSFTIKEKHIMANKLAAEFLVPEKIMRDAAHINDLFELKEIFPEASYELIARRLCDYIPVVITIFDNRLITARFASPGMNFPVNPSKAEIGVLEKCHKKETNIKEHHDLFRIAGYYLKEVNGIRRVIIILELNDPLII